MLIREIITDTKTGEITERMVDMPGVLTLEEAQAADLIARDEEARAERNARLLVCDWTALPDAPLDAAQRSAWAGYRQALRGVPEQAGFPDAIIWPLPPTDAPRVEAGQEA